MGRWGQAGRVPPLVAEPQLRQVPCVLSALGLQEAKPRVSPPGPWGDMFPGLLPSVAAGSPSRAVSRPRCPPQAPHLSS